MPLAALESNMSNLLEPFKKSKRLEHLRGGKFTGFDGPKENWFRCPKDIDRLMCRLTGVEFKVLMYILRHTWGYDKSEDEISLSQLETGIRKRNGAIVDEGTGCERQQIMRAIKKLSKFCFISATHKKGKTTKYHIHTNKAIAIPTISSGKKVTSTSGINVTHNRLTNRLSSGEQKTYNEEKILKDLEGDEKIQDPRGFLNWVKAEIGQDGLNWLIKQNVPYRQWKEYATHWKKMNATEAATAGR